MTEQRIYITDGALPVLYVPRDDGDNARGIKTAGRRKKRLPVISAVLIAVSLCVYSLIAWRVLCGFDAAEVGSSVLYRVFGSVGKTPSDKSFAHIDSPAGTLSMFFGKHGGAVGQSEAEEPAKVIPVIPEGCYPVEKRDLSSDAPLGLSLSNETSYEPELFMMYNVYRPHTGKVLIIHTHGTESYLPEERAYYSPDESFRTSDTDKNVVAVGEVIAQVLRERGIEVIHDRTMHDEKSYNAAYKNAASAIRTHLEDDPDIAYIFDVHRDSIVTADKTKVRPVGAGEDENAAQFMIVAGTDENGADFPSWMENLSFASALQAAVANEHPSLVRPINLRKSAFNEQYTRGSLLFEVGSCGNTADEAKRTAVIVANAVADIIGG